MADGDIRVVHPPGTPEFQARGRGILWLGKFEPDPLARGLLYIAAAILVGVGAFEWNYSPIRDHNASLAREQEARELVSARLTNTPTMILRAFTTPKPVIVGAAAVFTYPTDLAPYEGGTVFRVVVQVSSVGSRGPGASVPVIATGYAEDPETHLSRFEIPASVLAGQSGERFILEPTFILRQPGEDRVVPFSIDPRRRAYYDVP